MAWTQSMNRGWVKGPALSNPTVNKLAANTATKPLPGSPPLNPEGTTKPPAYPAPIPGAPTPAAPVGKWGANYVPRTGVPGSSASGGRMPNPADYRRSPSGPPPGGPPGGGADPNKPVPPAGPGGPGPAPGGGPVYGGGPTPGRGTATDVGAPPPVERQVPGQLPPPVAPPVPGQPPAPIPPRPNRPGQPGQVTQQAAQALYSQEFGAIPHEFKGQLMELARGGNSQAFNDALFNSNIPHEMKLRLQQLFGFGTPAQPNAPQPQPQGVPQPPPAQPQGAVAPPPPQGSPYYGAY